MVRQRKCWDCKKELTGKYYLIPGSPLNMDKASRANYCVFCCEKTKKLIRDYLKLGIAKIVEKEIGDKTEDRISDFEDKWERNRNLGIKNGNVPDNKTLLNSIQNARRELEPYLQTRILEQAWEKKYNNLGVPMCPFFIFLLRVRKIKNINEKWLTPQ